MSSKAIVFPTDFSHCSDAALEHATALARDAGGTLWIVHAEEPALAYAAGEMYYGTLEPDFHELQKMLREVKPADPSVAYEQRLLRGDGSVAHKIVEFARQQAADLIVMGTHGRTGVKRLLMGSVAEEVLRRAPCPVLVMRHHLQKAAAAS